MCILPHWNTILNITQIFVSYNKLNIVQPISVSKRRSSQSTGQIPRYLFFNSWEKGNILISGIISTLSFGKDIIYFIVFGEICKSLIQSKDENYITSKRFLYILVLAVIISFLVDKKILQKLIFASVFLLIGVVTFIIVFLYQLLFEGF